MVITGYSDVPLSGKKVLTISNELFWIAWFNSSIEAVILISN